MRSAPDPVVRRNREYDPFADLYNRFWGKEYRASATPVIEHLLLSALKPGASVLDVCCGTGQFAATLLAKGFEVTGVDASGKMIRHARRNARGARFKVADVRNFDLGQRFDAAMCVFESLNHIPDAEGLLLAFRSIRRHLRPRARFLFDLVGRATYRRNWNATHSIVEDDLICGIRLRFDDATAVGTCNIAVIERSPIWQRRDFVLQQYCHDDSVVSDAIRTAGFRDVSLHAARDLGMPPSLGVDRTFWLLTA